MSQPTISPNRETSGALTDALAAIDQGLEACRAYERLDLSRSLEAARQRLIDPVTRVLVTGEFKQGKSSLINALLNVSVCPVDDDIATSVPTLVLHAKQISATAYYEPEEEDGDPVAEPLDVRRLHDYVSELGNPRNERRLRLVEVGVPRRLLETGLSFIDTPGVGGLGSHYGALTVAAIPSADAVLMVTDASQELTEPEIRFLRHARELCPNAVLALTKTDLYPEWRRVLTLNKEHLSQQGFGDLEMIPISSQLRMHAIAAADPELNAESGFGHLVAYLYHHIIDAAENLSVKTAANALLRVVSHLRSQLETERRALSAPEQATHIQEELAITQQRVERLNSESARWQTTLFDGITDMNADIDHDLRERTRQVIREAEDRIDAGDPVDWWDEFDTWIQRRIAEEVVENYALLTRLAEALATTVAEHFSAEEDIEIGIHVEAPSAMLSDLPVPDTEFAGGDKGMKNKVMGIANRGYTGLRGSYGGYLMFSMIGGIAGVGALSPAIMGLTLLLGRRSIRDEKNRELQQRRQQAKSSVRRYVDEINFQVGKSCRDSLRDVQRLLRDGFTERAAEIQRTVTDTLHTARQAAQTEGAEREQRLKDVDAELIRIRSLTDRAGALAPDLVEGALS